jgi:RNA polymerase sigma-70 factor (ECF subfamily)
MANTEESLIRIAREGDRAAFEELVRRTSGLVFARLYLETGDTARAEDLLQETLLTAFLSIRQLTDVRGFRPWLLTIAQNVCIDAARRDSRQKRSGPHSPADALNGAASRAPPPDQQAEHEESRQKVLAVLRSLPEEYRLPLTLRYLGGADYETIALQLGLTNGSLRGLLHRGLKVLRDRLGPMDW